MIFGVLVTIIVSVAPSKNHFDVENIQNLYDRAISFQNKYNFGLVNSNPKGHFQEQYENRCYEDMCHLQYRLLNETYLDDLKESYKIENNKFKTLRGQLLHGRDWKATNKFTRYDFQKTDTGFTFENAISDDTENVRSFNISNYDLSNNLRISYNLSNKARNFVNDLISFHRKMIDFLGSLSVEDNHVSYYRHNSDDGNIVYIQFRNYESGIDKAISLQIRDGGISGDYTYDIQSQSFIVENGKTILQGRVRTTGAY